MEVEFTSGYTTEISSTQDYAIKKFPENISSKIRISLENFLKKQTFLQNRAVKTEAILVWAYDKSRHICIWFLASVDYDIVDHVQRQTFKVQGNIFVKSGNENVNWCIAVISQNRLSNLKLESTSFKQLDICVRSWPEFIISSHQSDQKPKKLNSFATISIGLFMVVCIFYLCSENRNAIEMLAKSKEKISTLEKQTQQQIASLQEIENTLDKTIKSLLLKKIQASEGISQWISNRYPSIENVFKKLAKEQSFSHGLQVFMNMEKQDKSVLELRNNYEPGFEYNAVTGVYKENIQQKIIAKEKINQYKAIAYYLGVLQFYKNTKKHLKHILK
ncbi:hypothetical protein [Candidatus Uabimicrobium sp. HlEnr_7]|uniref:hypothetical protein n=1 Tax=Candidatus Uabimicrobium helgolandensis TaxID=3095367 RepID=UPI0035589B09